MSYTVSDVTTIAQRLLVDIDDGAYENDLTAYFNEAQRRFASETHCCQKITNITATTNNIPFSDIVAAEATEVQEVLYVSRVQINNGINYSFLPKAPMSEIRSLLVAATLIPERYSVFAKEVYFDTHPDTTLDLDTTLYYTYLPVDQSGDDVILIPAEWVQALVSYIVYLARVADRDPGLANGSFTDYEAIRLQAATFYQEQMEGIS